MLSIRFSSDPSSNTGGSRANDRASLLARRRLRMVLQQGPLWLSRMARAPLLRSLRCPLEGAVWPGRMRPASDGSAQCRARIAGARPRAMLITIRTGDRFRVGRKTMTPSPSAQRTTTTSMGRGATSATGPSINGAPGRTPKFPSINNCTVERLVCFELARFCPHRRAPRILAGRPRRPSRYQMGSRPAQASRHLRRGAR